MNALYKLYCRTVHLGLQAAAPFLPYREPTVTDYEFLPSFLRDAGAERVLLVTGKNVRAHGLCAPLIAALEGAGLGVEIFDGVHADPSVACVEQAVALFREKGCDCIAAVGGGSPMDCAKGVCARIASPKRPLVKMKGALKVKGRTPYLVAVPTTAGSGSEATAAAVFTDETAHDKFAVFSYKLVPDLAILDPALTVSLPPAATAETGLDALTHAVEAYLGKCTTKFVRIHAERTADSIFRALPAAFADGRDKDARREMAQAAFMAGECFTLAYVGYVHALAHALGGAYGLPHGRLCAVLLPHVLRAYGKKAHKKLARLARACGFCGEGAATGEAAECFINKTEELCRALQIPEKIEINEQDIAALSRHAAKEANPLYPVPRILSREELARILDEVRRRD